MRVSLPEYHFECLTSNDPVSVNWMLSTHILFIALNNQDIIKGPFFFCFFEEKKSCIITL